MICILIRPCELKWYLIEWNLIHTKNYCFYIDTIEWFSRNWHAIYSLIESSGIPFLQEGVLQSAELTCSQLEEMIQARRDVQSSGLPLRFIYVDFGRNSSSGSSMCVISLSKIIIPDIFGMAFQICELITKILLPSIRNPLNFSYILLSQSPSKWVILLCSKFNVSIVLASALIGGMLSKTPRFRDKDLNLKNPWKYFDGIEANCNLPISNIRSVFFSGCKSCSSSWQLIIKPTRLSKPQKARLSTEETHPLTSASTWNCINKFKLGWSKGIKIRQKR